MEYFTLAEDLEEIKSAKSKTRNRILITLSILIMFFLLRGIGGITIEYNKGYFVGKHEVKKEIYELYDGGRNANQEIKNNKINTKDNDFHRDLGFSFRLFPSDSQKNDDNLKTEKNYLERLIKEKISKERIISRNLEYAAVSVKKLEMSGLYWFPLIKKGKGSYQIIVENRHYKNTYSATFSGEIDLEVYGICSSDKLEKIIAEKIAKIVVESIEDDYKK
jgi:hypothetical protein